MDIDEVRLLKSDLEKSIFLLLTEFTSKTGTVVDEIYVDYLKVDRTPNINQEKPFYVYSVDVTVNIEV